MKLAAKPNPFAVLASNVFGTWNTPTHKVPSEVEVITGHPINNLLQRLFTTGRALKTIDSLLTLLRFNLTQDLE